MATGFNTDVTHGQRVFHVQTEDRGPQHRAIDTVVYQNGRALHRHSSSYAELSPSDSVPDPIQHQVEEQHRRVIESLRSGVLDAEIAAADELVAQAAGIQVQLLNPTSWLAAGTVSLDVGVVRRADGHPQSGARVEALIDGSLHGERHSGTTDDQGRAKIEFPLPPLGKGDLALVIQAQSDARQDEIRFSMRSRAKANPPVLS
jgi:hypothetical protein